jgi:hypothetical protein
VQALYIDGDPRRTPWYLNAAISHALMVLSWFELTEDDRPPESIWLDDEAVSAHFDGVEQKRNSSIKGSEPVPAAGMDQNELTAELRR